MASSSVVNDEYGRVNPWLIRLPVLFILGGLLLVGVLAAFVVGVQTVYADRIWPGVWANGVNLSGLTREVAIGALNQDFTYDNEAVFTFRHNDQFWQFTAAELGVNFDADATVAQAMAAGRGGHPLANLAEQASIWLTGRAIAPIVGI